MKFLRTALIFLGFTVIISSFQPAFAYGGGMRTVITMQS